MGVMWGLAGGCEDYIIGPKQKLREEVNEMEDAEGSALASFIAL